MQSGCYRHIVNKVSCMYDKVSPRGCSQNTRIHFEDIDRAKNDIKTREKVLQRLTDCELSKLNTPVVNPVSMDYRQKKTPIFPPKIAGNSQRLHKLKIEPARESRHKTAEKVIDQCDTFRPELSPHKKELDKQRYFRMNTSYDAINYIGDLAECLKVTNDQERIKNMMSTFKYNRRLDIDLKGELKNAKQGLLETTDKISKMGKSKLWRQNNIALISITDKLISKTIAINN